MAYLKECESLQEDTLSNLPEVLVEFAAYKVLGAQVVLFNQELAKGDDEHQILCDHSYLIDPDTSTASRGDISKKIFFAERYGGDFISRNGGGGRCGFDGSFQLKGIGQTPLVGTHKDPIHSNGKLDLESAIHEAIWGEIIHLALPYGAARTVAVIRLNEHFVLDGTTHTRALLVREAVVRPAHFERAPLFKEEMPLGASLSNDALRVKKAIQRINQFLPESLTSDCANVPGRTPADIFRLGIAALAKRYAQQFAVARCKNIMHMMMSSSNLTMNGGWLDLNSVTIVSPVSVREKRLFRRFETEHHSAIRSIENICYYVKKYLPLSHECATEILNNAMAEFERGYELTLRQNVLVRTGFPQCVVDAMAEEEEFERFSTVLIRLMQHQTYELGPRQVFGELRFFSVPERPCVKNITVDDFSSGISIDWRVSSRHMSGELTDKFELFFAAALLKTDVSRKDLKRMLCINLTKYTRTPMLLQNIELYELIKTSIRNAESELDFRTQISSLVCEAKAAAEICLAINEKFSALMWKCCNDYIEYDGTLGRFCIVFNGVCECKTWAQLVILAQEFSMVRHVVEYYDAVREVFLEV